MKLDRSNFAKWATDNYRQDLKGIHGISHWARVFNNGRIMNNMLSEDQRVDEDLLFIFAFFHDTERTNEGYDTDHGTLASNLLESINGSDVVQLDEDSLNELCGAMELHSDGVITGTLLQKLCYDSDRLDLWRADITIDPKYLCTDVGKKLHEERKNAGFYEKVA